MGSKGLETFGDALPEHVIHSDASTTIGVGGWMGVDCHTPERQFSARWTGAEQKWHTSIDANINVLEYAAMVMCVVSWSDRLEGSVIAVYMDNTTAVSWALRQRGKGSVEPSIGELVVKFFSLFCSTHRITIVPSHIAGTANTLADSLSRDVCLQQVDPTLQLLIESADGSRAPGWWRQLPKAVLCRVLLQVLWSERSNPVLQSLLPLVEALR
jgi:hypothetical protein